jgi:hypothetical protein
MASSKRAESESDENSAEKWALGVQALETSVEFTPFSLNLNCVVIICFSSYYVTVS